jgi:hypothetical protein
MNDTYPLHSGPKYDINLVAVEMLFHSRESVI